MSPPEASHRGPIKSERNHKSSSVRQSSHKLPQPSSAFHAKRAHKNRNRSTAPETASADDNKEASSSSDAEGLNDIRRGTVLSLVGHPLPPLAALVETLSQFRYLQRLDLSALESSEANPQGLTRLDWLAKAVFRSQRGMNREAGASSAFGDSLTWLNVSSNPKVASDGCVGLEALEQLHVLTMSSCKLQRLPSSINPLSNLRALVLNNNLLTELPSNFPHLVQLNSLILSHNKLKMLPASLPASLPALKKLSLGHNQLTGPDSLPDFSVCLSLRDVRINDNKQLSALPGHINVWGKGADGNTAPGLELLELKDCGLDSWSSLGALVPTGKNPQPHGRKGLTQLLLKGNGVAKLEDYKERILEAHPTIRVLDNERLHPRQKNSSAEVSQPNSSKTQTAQLNGEVIEYSLPDTRNEEVEREDIGSGSDDEEAARMAAEMRAMRKGSERPSSESKKVAGHISKNEQRRTGEEPERANAKLKHKRGTRSGTKQRKDKVQDKLEAPISTKTSARQGKGVDSRAEAFFEPVDEQSEKARLAHIHRFQKQKDRVQAGRNSLAEGVLEDSKEPTTGKARRLESKSIQELEMTDAAEATLQSKSGSARHKKKHSKTKQNDDEEAEHQRSTSVASIIDVRGRAEKRSGDQLARDPASSKRSKVDTTARDRTAFLNSTTRPKDSLGAGGNAWGDSNAWT